MQLGFSPPPLLRTTAALSGLLGLGIVSWGTNIGPIPLAYIVGGVALLVALYVVLIVRLLRTQQQPSSDNLTLAQLRLAIASLIEASPAVIIAMTIPPMTTISTLVGRGLVPVKLIEVLLGQKGPAGLPEITLHEIVNQVYLNQARAGLLTLLTAAAIVGVLALLLSGIMAFAEQWSGIGTNAKGD
jgi:hypothetical protein